ncbi:phosphatase PAP2 family protein [Streptomyces sp. NPDC058758]|uniref:phosphatase PAP2 family protein n=1 Tax=Streptomyces sp. NPDC058758 TaxID=3346627 RepID=UPI0036909CD7
MGGTDAGPGRDGVLPGAVRGGLAVTAVLAALVVVALGVRYGGDGAPGRVDARVWALTGGPGPSWRAFAEAVDFLGEPVGAAALVLGTATGCLLLRRPRAAVLVVAGTGAAVAATTLLKPAVGRTIHGGHLAFPSGHTGFLTAYALVVALLVAGRLGLGRPAGLSLVLAAGTAAGAVMGWAQIVLDAHYPTDVLGGWATALAVVPATAWAVDRVAGTGPRTGR